MQEKKHVLKLLKDVKNALRKKDYVRIKTISDKIVHTSSIDQDADIIFVAVIIYSLSKIIEREQYQEYKNWNSFYNNYIRAIDKIIISLEKDNLEIFRKEIKLIISMVDKLSGKLKIYVSDVFKKAKINKASKIYDHGISMSKTSKILGISIWELSEYTGQSEGSNINLSITMPVKERIKLTEEFFN